MRAAKALLDRAARSNGLPAESLFGRIVARASLVRLQCRPERNRLPAIKRS